MKNVLLASNLVDGNIRSREDHVPYHILSTSYDSSYLLLGIKILSVSMTEDAKNGEFYNKILELAKTVTLAPGVIR